MFSYYWTIILLFIKKVAHPILMIFCIPIVKVKLFKNYRNHLISTWLYPNKRTLIDKILYYPFHMAWIKYEYLVEKDPVIREQLKEPWMGGSTGADWAKYYNLKPITDNDIEQSLFYSTINNICKIEDKLLVIQVGSSSGREVYYFAQKYPKHHFIGTDIYSEVINYASVNHKADNLNFTKASAIELSKVVDKFNTSKILIISSGSLQYVQPEYLARIYNDLKSINCMVILQEPANNLRGNPDQLKGSLYRGNFSYTHNYKYYAEENGFVTVNHEIHKPFIDKTVESLLAKGTVHYIWHGRSTNCTF